MPMEHENRNTMEVTELDSVKPRSGQREAGECRHGSSGTMHGRRQRHEPPGDVLYFSATCSETQIFDAGAMFEDGGGFITMTKAIAQSNSQRISGTELKKQDSEHVCASCKPETKRCERKKKERERQRMKENGTERKRVRRSGRV